MTERHLIAAGEDANIVVQVFDPGSARGIIVLPCAMGVAQKFYQQFAEWLAQQGFVAITFDYRGIGLSAPQKLRGYHATIFDWARDCEAVIDFAVTRYAPLPLYWVGHSLGGQLLGLIGNRERIHRIITIATGNGYWLENTWQTKRVVWWLWFVVVPIATRVAGYFPGKRLRKVGDLPLGVMRQWRRWCLNPEYVVGVEGERVREQYSSVSQPMMSLSFTDDEMMTERGTRSLHRLYRNAAVEFRRIAPDQIGVRRIGHFGFFRPQFERTLWPLVPQWLTENR